MMTSVYPGPFNEAVRSRLQRKESLIPTVKALLTTGIWCEVKVILANLGDAPFAIARRRIARLVPAPVQRATFDETVRGAGGIGSTGM